MTAYDTVENADLYFANKLHSSVWTNSLLADKEKALLEATLRLDNLCYSGYKVSDTQEREFPRYYDYDEGADGTETVPDKIKYACFELAYSLLDDVDPEREIQDLSIVSHSYSTVRSVYNHSIIPDYIAAGIPNILAWQYLLPYLCDNRSIRLNRIS